MERLRNNLMGKMCHFYEFGGLQGPTGRGTVWPSPGGTPRRQRFGFYCCYLADLRRTLQPEQLELMVRLLEKVQLSMLRGHWLHGFCNSCYEAK